MTLRLPQPISHQAVLGWRSLDSWYRAWSVLGGLFLFPWLSQRRLLPLALPLPPSSLPHEMSLRRPVFQDLSGGWMPYVAQRGL